MIKIFILVFWWFYDSGLNVLVVISCVDLLTKHTCIVLSHLIVCKGYSQMCFMVPYMYIKLCSNMISDFFLISMIDI